MTPADQARLAADWATILQSEWAGLATDREVHDTLHRAANQFAQQAALLHAWPPAGPVPTGASPTPAGFFPTLAGVFPAPAGASDDPSRLAGANAPPRSAAADAAPGAAGAAFLAGCAERIAPAGGIAPGLG